MTLSKLIEGLTETKKQFGDIKVAWDWDDVPVRNGIITDKVCILKVLFDNIEAYTIELPAKDKHKTSTDEPDSPF
jgi:hypothetical protein